MKEYIVEKRQTSGGWTWAEPKGELIRCKDCKYYHVDPWGYGNCGYTEGFRRTHEKDYCSWAERKEE